MNLVVLHKLADLQAAGDAGSRAARIAEGLIADASTRIVYHQDESQVPLTRSLLGLSSSEARLISMLSPGQALWRVGPRVVRRRSTTARGLEALLTNTDTGMNVTATAASAEMSDAVAPTGSAVSDVAMLAVIGVGVAVACWCGCGAGSRGSVRRRLAARSAGQVLGVIARLPAAWPIRRGMAASARALLPDAVGLLRALGLILAAPARSR